MICIHYMLIATHTNHIQYAVTTQYRLQSATVTLLRMSTSVAFLRTNAPSAAFIQVRHGYVYSFVVTKSKGL